MRKCIHVYTQKSHNQGFADFIRGSICLYQYCNKYNYTFYIDQNSHPVFQYLQHDFYINDTNKDQNLIIEKIRPNPLDNHKKLTKLFKCNKNINICTSALYLDRYGNPTGYDNVYSELSPEYKKFAKTILQPNEYLEKHINKIFNEIYQINSPEYSVIHLRLPDIETGVEEKTDIYNPYDINNIIDNIRNILIKNDNTLHILLCSSNTQGKMINEKLNNYSNFKYWDNNKVHIGYVGEKPNHQLIIDTLIDFFTIARSNKIYQFSVYGHGSGFSQISSRIFDIKIERFNS